MTMTPEQFHDLLGGATADPPPTHHDPAAALRAGRRSLRRRRLATGVGASVVVALLGTAMATALGPSRDHATPVAPPHTDAQLLAACRSAGGTPAPPTGLVFGQGTPTVESVVRTDDLLLLAVEARGGRYWAQCSITLGAAASAQGFPALLEVFDSHQRSNHQLYSTSGCAIVHGHYRPSCTNYEITAVDRLPVAVAAVRYRFGDGGSLTVRSRHGYVVLNRLAPLPDPTPGAGRLPGITRITYLDAGGRALAAMALDGTGTGRQGRVDGLPPLKAYASLRGDPIRSAPRGGAGRTPRSPGASSAAPPASPPGTATPAS